MKLIVGLGNPGKDYQATRHNVGWMVLDAVAKKLGAGLPAGQAGEWRDESHFEALAIKILPNPPFLKEGTSPFAKGDRGGFNLADSVLLAKPTTFMNNSGRAVQALLSYYKLDPSDLIVVHDELDLPLGAVRTRLGGTTAGHNGVGSLIHHLGTDQFLRVRVGIETDHPQRMADPAGFVLAPFAADERAIIDQVVDETASHLVEWLTSGEIPETSFTIQ